MTNLVPIPEITPAPLEALNALPNGFLDAFLAMSASQRTFLIKRLNASSRAEAAKLAGVAEQTVYSWRAAVSGFKFCEEAILAARGDSTVQLARAIYKAAIPEVAVRQVEQALEDHKGLSAQALMAQQRAREAVSKGAGLEAEPAQDLDPLLSFISAVAKLRQASLPSLDVSPSASEKAQRQLRALQAPDDRSAANG